MFQINVAEIIKTHILFQFFFFQNFAVYDIRRKNVLQPSRRQMTIWRMRITCWIPKTADSHSEYVILDYILITNFCALIIIYS